MAKNRFKFPVLFEGDATKVEKTIAQLQNKIAQLKQQFEKTEINSAQFTKLAGEIRGLEQELVKAKSSAGATQVGMFDLLSSFTAASGAVAGLVSHYSALINASRELENSKRKLLAASKLQGTEFSFLAKTAAEVQNAFKLNTQQSNEFTIAVSKLATKAGDVNKTGAAIKSLLDLAAAQGLNAEQALVAMNQALLGIDEGTDKLFQKNPMDLYKEYGKQIGVSAEKMSDAQKAQAILNALMTQGAKVAGEYGKTLDTTAGQQQLLNNKLQELNAKLGKEADAAFGLILKAITPLVDLIGGLPTTLTAAGVAFGTFAATTRIALTAVAAFNATVAASPIGAIALAVGGLAALFQVLASNTDKASDSNRKLEEQTNRTAKKLKEFGDVSKQVVADIQKENDKSKKSYEDWIEEVVKLEKAIKKLKGVDVDKELAQVELASVNSQIGKNAERLRRLQGYDDLIDARNTLGSEQNELLKRKQALEQFLKLTDEKKGLEDVKKASGSSDEMIVDDLNQLQQKRLESEKKILELQPNQVAQRERIKQIEREILELKLEQAKVDATRGKSPSEIARMTPLIDSEAQSQRDLLDYQQAFDDLNAKTGNERDAEINADIARQQAEQRRRNSRIAQERAQSQRESAVEIGSEIGGSAANIINSILEFNSEAAKLERERKEESIRIERERLDELREMNEEEYSNALSSIQNALNNNQISQAEANERFLKAEKKRSKESEDIKRKEIELDKEQQRLRAQNSASSTAAIIANTAIQFAAEYVLVYLKSTGDPFSSLIVAPGISAITGVLLSQLQGMIQQPSFATGEIFNEPTLLPFGARVGDGKKSGSPVDMEALLNTVQLAEFGRRYSEKNSKNTINLSIPVSVNAQTQASQYDIVLAYEDSFKSVVEV